MSDNFPSGLASHFDSERLVDHDRILRLEALLREWHPVLRDHHQALAGKKQERA